MKISPPLFLVAILISCTLQAHAQTSPGSGDGTSTDPKPNKLVSSSETKSPEAGKTPIKPASRPSTKKDRGGASLPPPSKLTQDFYNAYRSRNTELAEKLLKQGADINCKNCGDAPLLVWASSQQFLGNAPPDAISWLLAHGANPNLIEHETGFTPLQRTILMSIEYSKLNREFEAFESAIQDLIAHGAQIDLPDSQGRTPMHTVARYVQYAGNSESTQFAVRVINALVKAGGKINQTDAAGSTPLMEGLRVDASGQVLCNAFVVRTLLDLGSDTTTKNKRGKTAYGVAYDVAVAGARQCNPLLEMLSGPTADGPSR